MEGFEIKSNFFCSFKLGDNVNYNLKILNCLYESYNNKESKSKNFLVKPIVIILMAINEAILSDFYGRINKNKIEGILNLSSEVLSYIRNKKIDELDKYIANAKKHDFFNLKNTNFYDKLDVLRKVRNRIHIQNLKLYKPLDEHKVFTEDTKISAEKCTEAVAKTMSRKFYRPKKVSEFVETLHFPWKEHFPNWP